MKRTGPVRRERRLARRSPLRCRAATAGRLLAALVAFAVPCRATDLFGRPLRSVRFACDFPVEERDLRALIPIADGEAVTETGLEEARRLLGLKEVYRRIELRLLPEGEGVALLVELWRKRTIGRIDLEGLDALSGKEARRLVRIDQGMIYDPERVEAARQRLLAEYEEMGFVSATVAARTEVRDHRVVITFDVSEGEPLVVSSVAWEGDVDVLDDDLREEGGALVGERRTRDLLRETERTVVGRLRRRGYYEARVSAVWEPGAGSEGAVRLAIEAGPVFEIEVEGNEEKDRDELLGLVDLESRLIVTDGTWRQLARRMKQYYEENGYLLAEVDVDVGDGTPKRVRFRIVEGRRYRLRHVRFDGNERIADDRLRDEMMTAPARWFPWPRSGFLVGEVLREDRERLAFFYRRQGFHSAKVVDTRRELDEDDGSVVVTIVIEEGPRTMVREVDTTSIPPEAKLEEPALRPGEPLDPEAVKADRASITAALLRAGHARPVVEAVIDEEPAGDDVEAAVTWRIDPGPRQEIGRIIVQRNVETRSKAIRRALPFKEGDPLVVENLLQGQVDVYQLGLFRSVSIEPITPEEEAVRDVAVIVSERPAGTLELGAGYNTRDGVQALADVGYKNIGGMGRRVNLRGEFSLDPTAFTPDQYLLSLGFVEPRLFDSKWKYKGNLIGERSTQTVDKYSIKRFAFLNIFDRALAKDVNAGLEAQFELSRIFDVKPDAAVTGADKGNLRTVALTPYVLYDTRDDPFSPTRGLIDNVRLRYGLPGLSTVHFTKLTTQHTHFVSLADEVVLTYSARVGWGRAFSGADFLPIRERFFLGGRTTVRGFGENSIGPRGSQGSEVGGDLSLNLNLELQVPLLYGLGAAFFVDGGGVYLVQCDSACRSKEGITGATVTWENFRRSAGLGLRYNTPVGPIALDYGIKLDRRHGESFGRLHFSIGTIF